MDLREDIDEPTINIEHFFVPFSGMFCAAFIRLKLNALSSEILSTNAFLMFDC
jgi:hypothetical protein